MIRDIEYIRNAKITLLGPKRETVDNRMIELYKNLSIFIKASCVESMLFVSVSENESAIQSLKHCSNSLEKYFNDETRLKLNSNIGRNSLEKDFWQKKFPDNMSKVQEKITYVEKKQLYSNQLKRK